MSGCRAWPSRVGLTDDLIREFEVRLADSSAFAVRVAYRVVRPNQDAKDVAQDAFARAYRCFSINCGIAISFRVVARSRDLAIGDRSPAQLPYVRRRAGARGRRGGALAARIRRSLAIANERARAPVGSD